MTKSARTLSSPGVAALVVALALTHTSVPADASFPTTSIKVANWSPTFMQWPLNLKTVDAVAVAKRFDVIGATKNLLRPHVPAMKLANPNLKILVYMNGGFSQEELGTLYPSTWYARDASGNKIRSTEYGNYLMQVWNKAWVDHVAATCLEYVEHSGYDGCLLDAIGTAPLYRGYCSGLPVNPATKNEFTRGEWLAATSSLVRSVKEKVGADILVVPNGIRTGPEYFDAAAPTRQMLTHADGGFVELFIRGPNTGINQYKSETTWKKDVDMLVDAGAMGKSLLTVTKVWVNGTKTQKNAWHRYALGSFLLGTNGRHYFSFLYDNNTIADHKYWSRNLGKPLAAYAKVGPIYQRAFANGKVLVNPSTSSHTLSLGGTFVDQDGVKRTSLTLPPHTGWILTKSLL